MSVIQPQWCEAIVQGYENDPHASELLSKLVINPTAVVHFSLVDGILRF